MSFPNDPVVDGTPVLSVRNLRVHYPIHKGLLRRQVGTVRAVDDISLTVGRGETLSLVGESGCGKTSAGRAILQLIKPTAGEVLFEGIDLTALNSRQLRRMRQRFQIIFQDPYGSLNPRRTIGQTLAEPLAIHRLARGRQLRVKVAELLGMVGLSQDYASRFPHEFSGGQRQRVGIARALASPVSLVVCDEPISALDVSIRAQIANLLQDLQDRLELSYLFIAHDLSFVRHLSDRVAVMYLGQIVEMGPRDPVYDTPLHPYTIGLMSAVPVPDPVRERARQRIIPLGDVPSPADPPSGCRFHPRCWLRERLGRPERCASEQPQLRELAQGHSVACHFSEELSSAAPPSGTPASQLVS